MFGWFSMLKAFGGVLIYSHFSSFLITLTALIYSAPFFFLLFFFSFFFAHFLVRTSNMAIFDHGIAGSKMTVRNERKESGGQKQDRVLERDKKERK